jgi:hypothetical protein
LNIDVAAKDAAAAASAGAAVLSHRLAQQCWRTGCRSSAGMTLLLESKQMEYRKSVKTISAVAVHSNSITMHSAPTHK